MTPTEAYEKYVGSITPEEFIKGFDQIDGKPVNRVDATESAIVAAVSDLIHSAWWDGATPENLDDLLITYCKDTLNA